MAIITAVAKRNIGYIFKHGDVVKVIPLYYDEDTIIVNASYNYNETPPKVINPEQIAPKGSYKSYVVHHFDNPDIQYSEKIIRNHVGYIPLHELFEIIPQHNLNFLPQIYMG